MRLVKCFRGDRSTADSYNIRLNSSPKSIRAARDRSKSVCVTSFQCKAQRDVSAFKLFHRRASSVISSASDLITRRGVFSRRYYGSVEQLNKSELDGTKRTRRFRIENGESPGEKDEMFGSPRTPILENPEYQTRWYFKYFLGKLHQNYVGVDNDKLPYFVSIVLDDSSSTDGVPLYRAILFRKMGTQKIALNMTAANKTLTVKHILSNFPNVDALRIDKGPKEVLSPDLQKDLLLLEEQEGSVNFKFGVIYMRLGQCSDDEILSNELGSEQFDTFLNLLGERIRLKSWDRYRGGLDTKSDMTGKFSVYTIYEGHEIMFHVSTMLPYSRENRQQVERKRHIGNDIVTIVFVNTDNEDDSNEAHNNFHPTCIKSHFIHIFVVVTVISATNQYRLSIWCDESVPLFGPSLPCPPVFHDEHLFREFLLVKLINGEKAAFETPTFAGKRERTLDMLIRDMHDEHTTASSDTKLTMLNRRAFSDALTGPSDAFSSRGSRLKEDARQIEFVRIGQALKLEAIVRGDAPTSLASAGTVSALRRSPWQANCFYPAFPQLNIIDADSWSSNRLVIATDDGLYLVEDGISHRLLIDKSLQVKQLDIVEAHGILLMRATSGRDLKMYVFRLSQLDAWTNVKSRFDLKDHCLERTRGVNFYALSRPGGAKLRMCILLSRKLLMFQWKHSAAWTAWCPANDTDTVEGFTFLWEVTLNETPTMATILDSYNWNGADACAVASYQQGDILVCVGYKHHWEIVNGRAGHAHHFYTVDNQKVHLVAAIDLYEDQQIQLLLCYNHTCHFQKVYPTENAPVGGANLDFHWNSTPSSVVCAFPYIIAFTPSNTMEIRLIVNGNLVHTMSMPKLSLLAYKSDIFFTTTAPEFFPQHSAMQRLCADRHYYSSQDVADHRKSPPTSPGVECRPLRIYRIPQHTLNRGVNSANSMMKFQQCGINSDVTPTEIGLAVPESVAQQRLSRSATNSPVPSKLNRIISE